MRFTLLLVATLTVAVLGTSATTATKPPLAAGANIDRQEESRKASPAAKCRSAQKAAVYYMLRHSTWKELRGVEAKPRPLPFPFRGCAYQRWLANRWHDFAVLEHKRYEQHIRKLVITDHNWWRRDVKEVQKIWPGTESWLMSCSASEGGWGRWVGYGGVPYSPAYERTDAVGGQLQFRPSTFYGFIRHAIQEARSKGFIVPKSAWSWLSSLGQALAGAWGITHGMRSHWAGAGCQ